MAEEYNIRTFGAREITKCAEEEFDKIIEKRKDSGSAVLSNKTLVGIHTYDLLKNPQYS